MTEIPVSLLRGYVAMLPVLEGEESFLHAERVAVGSGSLKQDRAEAAIRRWTEAAENQAGKRRKRVKPTPGGKPDPGALAAMGIGYHIVETKQ